MNRLTGIPVLALVLTAACENATGPDRGQHGVAGSLFQQGPSDAECVGVLPPGTYQNVTVPEGQTCEMSASTITGNIKALARSQLVAFNNNVAGNIQGEAGSQLSLTNNEVGANIQGNKAARMGVQGGFVGGNIEIFDGLGTPITPIDYDIRFVLTAGNIDVVKNTGGIRVEDNFLSKGDITIADNVAPTDHQISIFLNGVVGSINVFKNSGDIGVNRNFLRTDDPLVILPGKGSIKVEDNVVPAERTMNILNNSTPQHIQVFKNTGLGSKNVTGNIAIESVVCKENQQPFNGTGNIAPKLEGQCGVPPTDF